MRYTLWQTLNIVQSNQTGWEVGFLAGFSVIMPETVAAAVSYHRQTGIDDNAFLGNEVLICVGKSFQSKEHPCYGRRNPGSEMPLFTFDDDGDETDPGKKLLIMNLLSITRADVKVDEFLRYANDGYVVLMKKHKAIEKSRW